VAAERAVRSDPSWGTRLALGARERALTPSVVVAGMLVVAALVRIWLTRKVAAPWIMGDELEYSELAKSVESSGHFLFKGVSYPLPSIYPILIAPAWAATSMKTTYALAKTLNVLMMTTSGIPFYLWARRLVSGWHAVIGTALLLVLPSFAFTGTLMTENAALPAVLLALFLMALALERPTIPVQIATFAAIALASAIRLQALVLLLVLPTTIVLKGLLAGASEGTWQGGRRVWSELSRYWFSFAGLLAGLLVYVAYKAVQGVSLRSGLSSYAVTVEVHYSVRDATRWILYHFGEIAFSVGMIPASALIVLFALAWRRGFLSRQAEQAFVAVAVATSFWVVVQAGAFASHFSLRIEERNMLYVEPLLLLALVLWLAKGSPRPAGVTAVAVLFPTALLLTIPIEGLLNVSITADTFAFIPLLRLTERVNGGAAEMRTLLALGALAAGMLFALAPRRVAGIVLPAAVGLYLVVSSHSVIGRTNGQALAARNEPFVADPSWVDDTIGRHARAALLFTPEFNTDPHAVWQTEFWNRSVRRVYNFGGTDGTGLPSGNAVLNPVTGRIAVSGYPSNSFPRYVVVGLGVHLAGRLIAQPGRFALYRVKRPFHIVDALNGVYPDGWMGPVATWDRYDVPHNRPSSLVVTVSRAGVSGPSPARVRVAVGPLKLVKGVQDIGKTTASRVGRIRAGAAERFRIPVPRRPFRAAVTVAPTFSPSNFGSADTRQLGARVNFQLVQR
jgi:hypothetical protein